MIKLDDIYGDGVLTKKTLKKGINTAKPDKVDYFIYLLLKRFQRLFSIYGFINQMG